MSEENEKAIAVQKQEAVEGLQLQISTEYNRMLELGRSSEAVVVATANAIRRLGAFLDELTTTTKCSMRECVTRYTLPFSHEKGSLYVRFAKANPDEIVSFPPDITSVKKAMIGCGVLMVADGHSSQHSALMTTADYIVEWSGRFEALWTKRKCEDFLAGPVSASTARQLLDQIEPAFHRLSEMRKRLEEAAA